MQYKGWILVEPDAHWEWVADCLIYDFDAEEHPFAIDDKIATAEKVATVEGIWKAMKGTNPFWIPVENSWHIEIAPYQCQAQTLFFILGQHEYYGEPVDRLPCAVVSG